MKTIVVGYDGARPSERALARAAELARAFGSKLVVASVAAPVPALALPGAFGLGVPGWPAAGVEQPTTELWEQHRRRIDALLAERGLSAEFAPMLGQPADTLVQVAEEHDADLIVVGTREPGFVDRLLAGSVSQAVARRAHCDVLVVHPEEGEA